MGILYIRNPIAHGFVDGLLKRALSGAHTPNFCTHEAHTINIKRLSLHVSLAHVNDCLHPKTGADRSRSRTVLTGSGLGDNPSFTHTTGEESLANHIINFVRSRMK